MNKIRLMFERQVYHLLALAVLLIGVYTVSGAEEYSVGDFSGVPTPVWFALTIAVAVAHQIYVWLLWRTQLHLGLPTSLFGKNAFLYYSIGFATLGIVRVLLVFALAISNQNSLQVDQISLNILAIIISIPTLYLFYSVKRYFGFKRAMGIDHFDESYRTKPFVKQGIFRFTNNGMYFYGFLLLWVPGLVFASKTALLAALFNHLYIWVHYHCTEKPDIERIYGSSN